MVMTFPSDLDIFSPVNWSIPLWAQTRAKDPPSARAWASSFVMGKHQVEAAAVDLEGLAQQRFRQHRALNVPARPALAPRRVPGRVFPVLAGLP